VDMGIRDSGNAQLRMLDNGRAGENKARMARMARIARVERMGPRSVQVNDDLLVVGKLWEVWLHVALPLLLVPVAVGNKADLTSLEKERALGGTSLHGSLVL